MNIAVIPARAGSKGVPGKNLREVGGRPLVAWSILAAQQSESVARVIVSTDSEDIAGIARAYEADVIMRPDWAATDDAPIEAALWHVHQALENPYDYMVTLQPTVPVRPLGLIDRCLEHAVYMSADSVFTAHAVPRCWLWEETTGAGWADNMAWRRLGRAIQRQQAGLSETYYQHDGSVCVSSYALMANRRDRTGGRAIPFPTQPTVDIDTEADMVMADALLRAVPATVV